MSLMERIKHRRSVRTFDGTALREEDVKNIMNYAAGVTNPYHIPIEWRLLDAREQGLSSPVILGTDSFIAGKVQNVPHAAEAFGYAFEKILLHADGLNIGTTWIAGTMDRPAFERAMELKEGELMPSVSPLGYPADKMSLREGMMRKSIKADSRLDAEKLFFENSFETPFKSEGSELAELLEMVRWAPSAVNKQPWRVVVCGKDVHFYELSSKGYIDKSGFDLQKVDIGIAMSHFEMGLEEIGKRAELMLSAPEIAAPEGVFYVATYRIA